MKLQYLQAGQIVSTHGIRGEVKVLPWADGPEFLTQFSRIRIGGRDYQVESCRIQKTCNLLKIQGVDTVEAAQALREQIVEIYREDAPQDLIFDRPGRGPGNWQNSGGAGLSGKQGVRGEGGA